MASAQRAAPWSSRGLAPCPGAVRHRRGVGDPSGMAVGCIRAWGGLASWICSGRRWWVISEAQGNVEHAHPGGGLGAAPAECPSCSWVRGSNFSGRCREVLLSLPQARVAGGGREGGQRAACSLPSPPPTHSPAQPQTPLPQAPSSGWRDRATPIPGGKGQLG